MHSLNGVLRVSWSRDWFNWMHLETRSGLWYLWIRNSKVVCIWTKMISGHPSQISFLGFLGQPPGERNSVWETHIHTTISVFGAFGYQSLIQKPFPSRSNTFVNASGMYFASQLHFQMVNKTVRSLQPCHSGFVCLGLSRSSIFIGHFHYRCANCLFKSFQVLGLFLLEPSRNSVLFCLSVQHTDVVDIRTKTYFGTSFPVCDVIRLIEYVIVLLCMCMFWFLGFFGQLSGDNALVKKTHATHTS